MCMIDLLPGRQAPYFLFFDIQLVDRGLVFLLHLGKEKRVRRKHDYLEKRDKARELLDDTVDLSPDAVPSPPEDWNVLAKMQYLQEMKSRSSLRRDEEALCKFMHKPLLAKQVKVHA